MIYTASTAATGRQLRIEGLEIFTSRELIRAAGLEGFEEKPVTTGTAVTAIEEFYKNNHYLHIKVYIVEDSDERLVLFVDEGKLAKIVVHEKNNYYALKIKQAINLPSRVYNTDAIDGILEKLKIKFGLNNIRVELVKSHDYSENIIQINRELGKIQILEQRLPFFSRYPAEYELHFYFDPKEIERGFSLKNEGWGFNIDYNYPSLFIPIFSMYNNGLLFKKDSLETDVSAGFDPGLSGYVKIPMKNTLKMPPERRYFEISSEYRFMPIEQSIFTPVLLGRLYHSFSGRTDLGLNEYKYLSIRGTIAPGITPLEDLNIYSGFGCEWINIYDTEIDFSAAKHVNVNNGWIDYPYAETRLLFDPIPIRLGARVEKNYMLRSTYYFNGSNFTELELKGAHDFEFRNLSILSFRMRANIQSGNTPFHHNVPVSSQYFKGFSGRSYYSNRLAAISAEYRFSIYEDYIYTGIFCDWTVFNPEGFLISGEKNGLVAGPTGRFLIYDQFELRVYYGWDRLFPDGKSGKNLGIKLTRKW